MTKRRSPAAQAAELPMQACESCGRLLEATPSSRERFLDSRLDPVHRGYFYACACNDGDLQPMKAVTYAILKRLV